MRHDVYHYFQQACRRQVSPMVPHRWVSEDDAKAGFSLHVDDGGVIDAADYRCTTCMTLVAMCEHAAENLRGSTIAQARTLSAGELLSRHPEVPSIRRSRAHLAVAAVHAALEEFHL
jgi:NifU-like protein involved in Fe-S cluster formation